MTLYGKIYQDNTVGVEHNGEPIFGIPSECFDVGYSDEGQPILMIKDYNLLLDGVYRGIPPKADPSLNERVSRLEAKVFGSNDCGDSACDRKTVRSTGRALVVTVTEMCKRLGIESGDVVEVTIKRIPQEDRDLLEDLEN